MSEDGGSGVGGIVRRARERRGWSQARLAEEIGLSQRWVSDIETDPTQVPHARNLRGIAKALGLDLSELYIAAEVAKDRREAERVVASLPVWPEAKDGGAAALARLIFGEGGADPLPPADIRYLTALASAMRDRVAGERRRGAAG